jgi:CO/xanthine dehydrogenase Mo-binding subunit
LIDTSALIGPPVRPALSAISANGRTSQRRTCSPAPLGQIQGGVTQGVGWALNEEYIYDKDGRLENPGFLDYRCPVASDMPMIDAVLVENPNPRHPFGARGVGEVPIVPPMAAVANAIADAAGIRLRDLPMSPPRLRAALDRNGG